MPRMVGNASTDIAAPRAAIASLRSLGIGMSLPYEVGIRRPCRATVHGDRAEVTEVYSPFSSPRSHFTRVVRRGLLNQTHRSIAAGASKSIARDIDAMVTLAAALPRDHGGGSRSADARLRRRRA